MLIILKKNSNEEKAKMEHYDNVLGKSPPNSRPNSDEQPRIHNPLKRLWVWSLLNVGGQIVNIVESGFYLQADPPQCQVFSKN